jgi:hypothetical protein
MRFCLSICMKIWLNKCSNGFVMEMTHWKILKVKGVAFNALILDEMNVLIIKHYVMSFQK